MGRLRLAARALRLAATRSHADPTPDYDAASTDYDAFFGRVMGAHATAALTDLSVGPGDTVVELACGTGQLTAEVAERLGGRGRILAVDKSPGMLAVARRKLAAYPDLDARLVEGDMLDFLRGLPDASADAVVIGWAICYSRPVRLLGEVARVLRPGGEVLVIETRADALSELTHVLERVFADDPSLLTGLMRVNLPRGSHSVARWLSRAGLVPTETRDGEQVLPVANAAEAIEYVERSGAAAGFRDSVDGTRADEVRARLRAELEQHAARHGTLRLRHTFVVALGHRPAARTLAVRAVAGAAGRRR